VSWTVLFTKQAQKDARKLASAAPALKQKAQNLLELLREDPYKQPPPYEALVGEETVSNKKIRKSKLLSLSLYCLIIKT
jgi:Txe/YoeB family toxin of Txe-Axe toxin-antitoxin module